MDDQKYICEFCNKEKVFTNQHNKDVHQAACKIKLEGKRPSATTCVKNPIFSYFKRQCTSSSTSTESSRTSLMYDDKSVDGGIEDATQVNTMSQPLVDVMSQLPIDSKISTAFQAASMPSAFSDSIIETDNQIDLFNKEKVKCAGFTPNLNGDIYHHFPFQLLCELPIVFECNVLHHKDCFNNKYSLFEINTLTNKCCSDLLYNTSMKLVVQRANTNYNEIMNLNNKYLTYHQLQQKCDQLQKAKRDMELKKYNLSCKNSKLAGTLDMHQRILINISENNIPRLTQLISVALRNKRSVSYIMNKVIAAIDGIYTPNPSKDDKDLAFLVLKIGGPCLLDILFRAGVLPSVSLAYKMAKSSSPIISSVKSDILDCVKANVNCDEESQLALSLKLDETYVTPSLSYCSRDNSVYGVCYQHGSDIKLTLDNFEDCVRLKENLTSNNVHVPKECLVAGVASLNTNNTMHPVVIWPSCQKNDVAGTVNLIKRINSSVTSQYGKPLFNICTDGDSTRRQVANYLMDASVPIDSSIYQYVQGIPFLDKSNIVTEQLQTVSFDPKHLSKRTWHAFLRERITINNIIITKKSLNELIDCEDKINLLYPKDKQNVASATKILISFIDSVSLGESSSSDSISNFPYSLMSIKNELYLLSLVFKGILSFYVYVDLSLSDQLKAFAVASYILLFIYRHFKTNILPSQLYHDLQCTFINGLISCAKGKAFFPDSPLYFVLDGTDPLERFFGNCRMQYKSKGMNTLEMIDLSRGISSCDNILMNVHPEWSKKGRVQRRLCLDYSNPRDWTREKLICKDVNVKSVWLSGYNLAISELLLHLNIDLEHVHNLANDGITLRRPISFCDVVGVNEINEDWSNPDETTYENSEEGEVEGQEDQEESLTELEAYNNKHAPYFLDDNGGKIYKTTCLKNIFNSEPLSKDRLRRVRGLTTYPDQTSDMCNNLLMVGDPVLYSKKTNEYIIVNICKMTNSNRQIKHVDLSKDNLSQMNHLILNVREISTEEYDCKVFWTGKYKGDAFTISGTQCIPIKPIIDQNPPENMSIYCFDKQNLQEMFEFVPLSNQSSNAAPSTSTSSSVNQIDGMHMLVKSCFHCIKNIPLRDMRSHVGGHILRNEIGTSRMCGFCGKDACETRMKSSRKGTKTFISVESSDCPFYFDYGRSKAFNKKKNPTTNRIVACSVQGCKSLIWTYNLEKHFTEKHVGVDFSENFISQEEYRHVSSLY